MRTTIRFVALAGILALAVMALASMPAVAQDDVSRTAPRLNTQPRQGGILVLDRRYDNDQPSPHPIVPPDKEPKPGRLMAAPNSPFGSGDNTGGFGSAVLAGGGTASSKSELVERSLRATADRLR